MTLYLDVWNVGSSAWDAVDIDALALSDFRLTVSYAGPSTLTFSANQPQHLSRIGDTLGVGGITGNSFIRLRHSGHAAGVDPVFEGWLSVSPGDSSLGIKFTAIDPTGFSDRPLMSYGWTNSASPPYEAVPATGSFPRVVFNCKQDADDDYAWEREHDKTVGEIIAILLDDHAPALREELAAVPVGNLYQSADLTGLTFKPQEKFVIESEAIRSAIMRLLGEYNPQHKLVWIPGTRLWRVFDLTASPQVTITLNDATGSNIALSWNLKASTEGRYTAVQFYGPPVATQWDENHAIDTALSANILAGVISLPVNSTAVFPTVFPFKVVLGSELLTVSGSSASSLTVSTTASPHSAGDTVSLVSGVLASNISAGATLIPLTANHVHPAAPFHVNIDGELIEVTGYSGANLFCGPTRSAHTAGDVVYLTSELTLLNGGLTDVSNGPVLETYGAGVPVYGKNRWQITNAGRRRIFRWLKDVYSAPQVGMTVSTSTSLTVLSMHYQQSYSPVLLVRFAANNMGNGLWQTVNGWSFDQQTGIISTGSTYLYRYNPNPPLIGGITGPHVENPIDIKLVFCSPADPLTVRYPSSGYSGTAYSVFGVKKVKRIYDEMLAVGYELGSAYTTAQRVAQFSALAQHTHKHLCDVVYSGGLQLSGLKWDFLSLNRRVNIAALDADGNSLTTGWEAIGAYVTDVEFDFTDQSTTIGINTDKSAVMGDDFEKLKEKLKIRPLVPVYRSTPFTEYTPKPTPKPMHSVGQSSVVASDFRSGVRTELVGYFDPTTGERG